VVIEHNLDVLKTADRIIDLGPEGGDKGGYVIAEGTPEELASNPASSTGEYLREPLERARKKKPAAVNGAARGRRKVAVG
jgi:excinuclease ABC subunit A